MSKTIPLLGELSSAVSGGFVTDMSQVRGGTSTINKVEVSDDKTKMNFYHDQTLLFSVNTNELVTTGILTSVSLSEDGSKLTMQFVINEEETTVEIPLSDIFSAENYYTKTQINSLFEENAAFISFDKYITQNIDDNLIITDQSALPEIEENTSTSIAYLAKMKRFVLEADYQNGRVEYYTYWSNWDLYNTNQNSFHADRFYICNNSIYFKDGDVLEKLSYADIATIVGNLVSTYLEEWEEENIDSINERLLTLEDHAFPITMSFSANPKFGPYNGIVQTAEFTLSFTRINTAYVPDSIKVDKTVGNTTTTVYHNENPQSNSVSFKDENINATSTTYNVLITKDNVTKSYRNTYNLYPPLYVGFAAKDETFENMINVDSSKFQRVYNSNLSSVKTITNHIESSNIFILIPASKSLSSFKYGALNMPADFELLSQDKTLNNIKYKIYRSVAEEIVKGTEFDNLTITIS